jgi:deazaflavin-dependent oxidoreductase (nitroreductase family)
VLPLAHQGQDRGWTFAGLTTGLQILLLTSTGARTGAQRTTPVLYLRDGGNFVQVAPNRGQEHNPSWYCNLRVNPAAKVTLAGSPRDVIAREVTGPQRDRNWQQGCDMYRAWNVYNKRSPHREFPIMILSSEPLVTE